MAQNLNDEYRKFRYYEGVCSSSDLYFFGNVTFPDEIHAFLKWCAYRQFLTLKGVNGISILDADSPLGQNAADGGRLVVIREVHRGETAQRDGLRLIGIGIGDGQFVTAEVQTQPNSRQRGLGAVGFYDGQIIIVFGMDSRHAEENYY